MPQSRDNSFLCHRLWNMLSVRQQGYWGHCSSSFSHENKGYLFEKDTKERIHIEEDSKTGQLNNPTLKLMRKKMLAGEIPPECLKCKELEDGQFTSLRQMTNDEFGLDAQALREITASDGSVQENKLGLELLELRLTNHCNLGCRSCSPESSDKLIPIHKDSSYLDLNEVIHFSQTSENSWTYKEKKFSWTSNQNNWMKLRENVDSLKKIHLTGGEPLLIPEHIDFLEFIVSRGLSKNITLEYNSNLSFLPPRLLTLWKEFKKVQIGVSIDGPPAMNEYIRRGTNSQLFESNLRQLDELNLENFSIWFPFTLMNYNILSLPETYRYIQNLKLSKLNKHPGHKLLRIHILKGPAFLAVDHLPESIKQKIVFKFDNFIEEISSNSTDPLHPYLEEIAYEFSKLKNRLVKDSNKSIEEKRKLWEKFHYYTKKIDLIDQKDLRELHPELLEDFC
jgi:sulfatase maturation enzyme AslB (radical SAM superfamily)